LALIVSAHPYCARKLARHIMHQVCALSNKINSDREDGHCYSFGWIYRSWMFGDPYFSFQNQILFTIFSTKMNKKPMWEVKKMSRFLSTGHGILPSCGFNARETLVAKCELLLQEASPVDSIHQVSPLKQYMYLAGNISLQRSNCNIFGLTDTGPIC